MPESGLLKLAVAMGRNPQELEDEFPEYWLNRLLIFVNAESIARDR